MALSVTRDDVSSPCSQPAARAAAHSAARGAMGVEGDGFVGFDGRTVEPRK
jgi:hypothetical protein